jgi:tellurite resistance protein
MQQLSRETIPAPLRPLLAIHLAPAALLGTVAAGFHSEAIWGTFALLSSVGILALLAGAFWLLKAGFSPMWGALTFPLAALANFWLTLGDMWRIPGGIALVAATLIIPPIAIRIFKDWAKGQLAIKTNAATA